MTTEPTHTDWRSSLEACLAYYLKLGRITEACATDWHEAEAAYGSGDAEQWIATKGTAMLHHEQTGDCASDLIETSFNPMRSMDTWQLKRVVRRELETEYGKRCAMELAVRG